VEPATNVVTFPAATARGVGLTGAGLLVRVPPDAGSGALSVDNGRGASAPLDGFEYRGLGQLRTGQVVTEALLLHLPHGVALSGGEPLIDSELLGGPVRGGVDPAAWPRSFQAPARLGDAVFHVDRLGRLTRVTAAGGVTHAVLLSAAPGVPAGEPFFLGAVVAGGEGRVFGLWPTLLPDAWRAHWWRADDLAPVGGSQVDAVPEAPPCASGPDRVTALVRPPGGEATLASFPLAGTTFQPAVKLPPPPEPLAQPALLACGASAGEPWAAVGLADGRVAAVRLVDPAGWPAVPLGVATGRPASAVAGDGDTLVVAQLLEGTVTAYAVPGGAVRWTADVPRPTALGLDASAVAVVSDAVNDVVLLDRATGAFAGRRRFDLGASAASAASGAAFLPAAPLLDEPGAVAFPVSTPPALVVWRLGVLGPRAELLPVAPTALAWSPPGAADGRLWVSGTGRALGTSRGSGALGIDANVPLLWSPTGLVPWLGSVVAFGDDGVTAVVPPGVVTLADGPASFIDRPAVAADGRVLVVGSQAGEERARTWTAAQAATGGAPERDAVLPGLALSGFFIDGEPWALWTEDFLEVTAARVDDGGALGPARRTTWRPEWTAGLVSPNRRTTVVPVPGTIGGDLTAVRVISLDPAAGFPTLDRIELPGPLTGLAFDETGERLYLVVGLPDRLVVVE
jgi:hypothetical protein